MQSWREEQLQISSMVTIPDNTSKLSCTTEHGRFRTVHPSPLSVNSSPILIGGLDISYFGEHGKTTTTDSDRAIAVYVIFKYATTASSLPQQVVHRSHKHFTLPFPYIPSYLAFREVYPMLELVKSQIESHPELKPNVLFVDGNGQWHERRAGIASFVGVKTGIPTIGVAKSFYSIDGIMKKGDVLRDVRVAMREWYDAMVVMGRRNDGNETLLSKISRRQPRRTLILDTVTIPTGSSLNKNEYSSAQDVPVDDIILTSISQYAHGIAIPMKGGAINSVTGSNNSEETLAYALVGHGGNTLALFNRKKSHVASMENLVKVSKRPVYVSVGSQIALVDAVALCAQLCISRIPEPIREADLYGRKLIRERQHQQQQ